MVSGDDDGGDRYILVLELVILGEVVGVVVQVEGDEGGDMYTSST